MADIVHLRGLQLVLTFLPVYPNGNFSQDVFKVGPFRNERSLKIWRNSFLDCFQKELEIERATKKRLTGCTIPSIDFEPHDPEEALFWPQEPQVAAEEFLDILTYTEFGEKKEDWDRPCLWSALVRMEMKRKRLFIEMPVVSGPFLGQEAVYFWCAQFIQGVRDKAARIKGLRCRFFEEEFIGEDDFDYDEEHAYVISGSSDPAEEVNGFFNCLMKDLLMSLNGKA